MGEIDLKAFAYHLQEALATDIAEAEADGGMSSGFFAFILEDNLDLLRADLVQQRRHRNGGTQVPIITPIPPPAMRSGAAKDRFFKAIRQLCDTPAVRAVGFCVPAWVGKSTEKGNTLMREDKEGWKAKVDRGLETLAREGLIERRDAVHIVAQTRENVFIMSRPYEIVNGKLEWTGEPEEGVSPASDFAGRMKMWGEQDY